MASELESWFDSCSDSTPENSACYEEADSGKGYVVYDDYQTCQESWLLLPGFHLLPTGLLIFVFGIALCWCFFGVAIISDIFMASIEIITSKQKKVRIVTPAGTVAEVNVNFWNPTLANLSLMALGSSAPEILLAIIETISTLNKEPGELGPSTIVGSAAFNLLVISAVCLASVPDGEVRRISELPVFLCTTAFSLWAYIWLLIVYVVWTPDEITIAEALITLGMFPLLLGVSFFFDKKPWVQMKKRKATVAPSSNVDKVGLTNGAAKANGSTSSMIDLPLNDNDKNSSMLAPLPEDGELSADNSHLILPPIGGGRGGGAAMGGISTLGMTKRDTVEVQQMLLAHGTGADAMTDEEFLADLAQRLNPEQWDAMRYRINARKALTGGKHKAEGRPGTRDGQREPPNKKQSRTFSRKLSEMNKNKEITKVGFKSKTYSVMECEQRVRVHVTRWDGDLTRPVTVTYKTIDGTATAGDDYTPQSGELTFAAGERIKAIEIEVVDDTEYEPDETFYIELELAENSREGVFLASSRTEITIIDDDEPGIIMFLSTRIETGTMSPHADVTIVRKKGADGVVTCEYRTQDETAVAGIDYVYCEGTVQFDHGQTECNIIVPIDQEAWGEDDNKEFSVQLFNPTGGATIGRRKQCNIMVVPDEKVIRLARDTKSKIHRKLEMLSIHTSSWSQQFKDAMYPGGSIDELGEEVVSFLDLVLHYCSITWKVIFAIVPPTDIWGGWATFFCSLVMVGFVTAIIEQLATLFGCMVGLKDSVTAITFVALGTSLPDTFASKHATIESPTADAAIGNVTGSNSVNVFLGLGIPWTIASAYYQSKGEKYETPAGAIGFSVTVFTACACVAVLIFLVKRRFGGELGGSGISKYGPAMLFVFLWLLFIVLSSVQAYGHIEGFRR